MRVALSDTDWPAIRACFARAAASTSGVGARSDTVWQYLAEATYQYVLPGEDGTVEAYVLFDHGRQPDDWRYTLEIRDWAATTANGLRAIVGLVASHGTIGKDARFVASRPEPWSMVIGEQSVAVGDGMNWMARGLDIVQAVGQRGFPPDSNIAVTFSVVDALLPEAKGPWSLQVEGGRGVLKPTDLADVSLDARAFGPLFTGFLSPSQLALGGLVRGPAQVLEFLAAAFAGPPPYLVDFF